MILIGVSPSKPHVVGSTLMVVRRVSWLSFNGHSVICMLQFEYVAE